MKVLYSRNTTTNLLDKLPKRFHAKATKLIHEIYFAPDRKEAEKQMDLFIATFEDKYPKATKCLLKDKEVKKIVEF